MAAFGVKYFETIAASMISWFSGVCTTVTDFNVGSRLRTILEACAIELEQTYYQLFIGITNGIQTAVFNTFNFPALQAQAASGQVVFASVSPAPLGGYTIPSGTMVSTQGTATTPAVTYATTDTVVIPQGSTTVAAVVVASLVGSNGNATAGGVNVLVGAPAGVSTVTNPIAFSNGLDTETLDQQTARFQQYVANLSRGTLGAIENAARSVSGVTNAVAFDSPVLAVFVYDAVFDAYTDISVDVNLPSGTPQPALPATPSLNDALYIGAPNRYGALKADLDSGMVGGTTIWEYWNGAAWTTLPISADSTSTLKNSGFLNFTPPADWRDNLVDQVRKFWLRLRVTNPAVVTVATVFQMRAEPFPGVVYLVAMNASAMLPPSLFAAVANAVSAYSASGIRVTVKPPTITSVAITLNIVATPTADPVALQAQIVAAVTAFLAAFAMGQELYSTQLVQFVRNQSNEILDVQVVAPATNLDTSATEVLQPGVVTVTVSQ